MDKLEQLIEVQKTLQAKLGYDVDAMIMEERTAYIKEYVLHMEHEMHEMIQELPFFKSWKKYPTSDYFQNAMLKMAQEEWIDVLHFFLNLTIALQLTPDMIINMYMAKNAENIKRQQDTQNYKPCTEVGNEARSS